MQFSPRVAASFFPSYVTDDAQTQRKGIDVGGVGAARVTVRTQRIDCGDFPLCAEWAPRSGTWILPAIEVGAVLDVWDRVGWLFATSLLIPHGEAWSAQGDPQALGQLTTGVSIRLGRGG